MFISKVNDASVVPVLAAEMDHPEPGARQWAMLALERLGVPEGVVAAARYRAGHPSTPPQELLRAASVNPLL